MRLAVLSWSDAFYTTRRLLEAAASLGLEAERLCPTRCTIAAHTSPPVRRDGVPYPTPELVLPRVGVTHAEWGLALLDALVGNGAGSPASAQALRVAGDKLTTTGALRRAGLPVVQTFAVRERAHIDAVLSAVGGPPVVLKLRWGTKGATVVRAADQAGARSTLDALMALGHTVLVQPFVETKPVRDLRVLVLGDRAAAACWRAAPQDDFRSNVHRGATVTAAELDDDIAALALGAAKACGLGIAGVDLLETPSGWAVLEVNGSPGLEGIERATGADLASAMVQCTIDAAG